ncbi:MAG: sialate O-acetylesterase, partial [Akkermansiaceae bacterium]|nr:sialate O-acetylesterase [Akkermansiaceae bacterium]
MKTKKALTTLLAAACCGLLISSAHARTWTNSDGSKTFEGTLVSYDADTGKVTVDMNGREVTFDESLLSADDIAYAKEEGPKLAAAEDGDAGGGGSIGVAEVPDVLPDPDGKEADMSKPVQVFILMGQSNMLGFGNVNQIKGSAADKYPYLVDDEGNWNVRKDVRNVFFNNGSLAHNDWMTAANGNGNGKIGPEIGIGNYLGHAMDAPVLILKSCVGNRALGWDLLPPSADGTGTKGLSYQGDSEYGNRKVSEAIKAEKGWYAGLKYDNDVGAAQEALRNLELYYPGAKEYEVAGFFWWQGCSENKGNPAEYDKNLAYLFNDLKKDFNAPNAKFVGATLGEHDKDAALAQKMFAFADANEDAEFFYS